MRRLIALIGVLAAVLFVVYSAVTLYNTAYNLTSLEWQRQLYGGAAAGVVIYEALALILAGTLWKEKQRALAVGCVVLLVAATAWSFRLELVNQIHGQADHIAARSAVKDQSTIDSGQLDALNQQRKTWTARLQSDNLSKKTLREINDTIADLNRKIESVINRVDARPAIMEVSPDAALAARMLGSDETHWRDWLSLLGLAFWPLARILATPAAVQFWIIATAKQPEKEVKKEIGLRPTAVEPEVFADARKKVLAEEKKVYPAIEAMKANALALKGNAIDAAVAAVRAKRGDDALPLNEIMGELAVVHEARGLPQPSVGHSKAVGKRMEKLGFETVGRTQAYKEKKRGSHKHKATAAA